MVASMSSVLKNPVGRPREFDEGQVLDAVMSVFWRQGYEATSMADLLAATGLHKGSLYQAFGDKHSLFITALRRYIENLRSEIGNALLSADTAFDGIRNAMRKAVEMSVDEDCNPGCLVLNTLVEKGSHDPEIMQVLKDARTTRVRMITRGVEACQQEGSLRSDWPAGRITAMVETVVAGLAVTLKGPIGPEQAYALVDDLLAVLRAPEKQ
jgi:TetR/AcrR family transcriptional repressor of nem operon